MPSHNQDLHGNVPDKSEVALILIDVINDLEWDGGDRLLNAALKMAKAIAALKLRAESEQIPTIYVNDNFGKWQSDFKSVVEHCLHDDVKGKEIAKILRPRENDYFVLKPKHSGFFSTTFQTLLEYLQVKTLVLAGLQTNICVLFTANEAYMRDYTLIVPYDCSASEQESDHLYAMQQMRKILKADIRPSSEIDFEVLKREANRKSIL